jgi:uncharacterized protein
MSDAPRKTALITGASEGLGRDLAELFARDGHHLVLVARNEARLTDLAAKLRDQFHIEAEVIAQDLSVPDASQHVFERLRGKPIDFLVNNAGFGTHGPFVKADLSSQLAMIQVNIAALTHLTRLILPGMIERRGGRILNMASVAAFIPGPLMAVYYATKAYVLSFSEALANEVAGTGVTVTAVCPGPTKTEFQKRAKIEDSKLFSGSVMSSMDVARIGYEGFMRGKRVVITGLSNRLLVGAAKLSPRRMSAAIARTRNENR